jgi:hypothetical protein
MTQSAAIIADLVAPLRPADERDAFGLLIDPVSAGLARLERCPPLWGDRVVWSELLIAVGAFHARWSAHAGPQDGPICNCTALTLWRPTPASGAWAAPFWRACGPIG